MSGGRIAILIDGGFFLKRLPKLVAANRCESPGKVVPAAKLARREGIEFILDPLWQQVNPDLFEHIDGLQSGLKRPSHRPSMAPMTELAVEQQDN